MARYKVLQNGVEMTTTKGEKFKWDKDSEVGDDYAVIPDEVQALVDAGKLEKIED